jgi:hypothetical protein
MSPVSSNDLGSLAQPPDTASIDEFAALALDLLHKFWGVEPRFHASR